MSLITLDERRGLYCADGDFYVDPFAPVKRAVITHAHADHARSGNRRYYATRASEGVLRHRLGDVNLELFEYGERFRFGPVTVSLHPAGHVLGSAQVRIESETSDEVWVIAGDYKRAPDPTCEPFEVVPCSHFVTEATFGLPVYVWDDPATVVGEIHDWWRSDPSRPTLLFSYAFGKAQRILAELAAFTDRTVYLHGAVDALMPAYRAAGVRTVPTRYVGDVDDDHDFAGDLIVAPPSAHRSPWMQRFRAPQTGFASGWMAVRGGRRRRGYERGFVLSDHVDWPALIDTVDATGASTVYVTHGQNDTVARYLRESRGLDARPLRTLFEGEGEGGADDRTRGRRADGADPEPATPGGDASEAPP